MKENKQSAGNETVQMVGFTVTGEEYGVEILKVREIIRMVQITRIPNTPGHVEGVINLRGQVIPVIDFKKRFNLASKGEGNVKERRIVVVAINGMTIGLTVDKVSQVFKLTDKQISPPPGAIRSDIEQCISGVGKLDGRLVILLRLEELFAEEELAAIGRAA